MENKHPTDLLPALALGCLNDEERAEVELHLQNCLACRNQVQICDELVGVLAFSTPLEEPDAALREKLLQRVQTKRQPALWFVRLLQDWPRMVPAATLCSFLLVAVLGLNQIYRGVGGQVGADLFADVQVVALTGTPVMPEARGSLLLAPNETCGLLSVQNLRPLQPSQQYQLWLVRDGQRSSGGVFSVSEEGRGRLLLDSALPLENYQAFGITIEPFGGSPGPSGPNVLSGALNS